MTATPRSHIRLNLRWFIPLILVSWLLPGSAQGYTFRYTEDGTPARWYQPEIQIYLNTDGFSDFDPGELVDALERSTQAWEEIGVGVYFHFVGEETSIKASENDGVNLIYFVQDQDFWTDNFHSETAVAYNRLYFNPDNGEILAFDIAFNDWNYDFTNTDTDASTDFVNTLTHELGHALGLEHSEIEEATMFATSARGDLEKQTLHDDDREGMRQLYVDGFREGELGPGVFEELFACSTSPNRQPGSTAFPLLLLLPAGLFIWRRRG